MQEMASVPNPMASPSGCGGNREVMQYYAHSLEGKGPEEWEPLFTPFGDAVNECRGRDCERCESFDPHHGHLNKVARWTAKFAAEMFPPGPDRDAAYEWGYLAGLWHDLGKFAPEWQQYLTSKADPHLAEIAERIDHATAGAQHAIGIANPLGHLLAYAISGHHSGLLDAISENACLQKRFAKTVYDFSGAPSDLLGLAIPDLPQSIAADLRNPPTGAFYTRMLFSALVDADFLATEAFMNASQARLRATDSEALLPDMLSLLERKLSNFPAPEGIVDVSRAAVQTACARTAGERKGLFSLTVPTGGGKTLASLSFALHHASEHGHRRVIYVIPFTSIIEQNAAVFESVFEPLIKRSQDPVVIQHHSNLSPDKETERSRLAAENWDAPLIITTAVQFYESLHAARTSSCRKLHNIANSVVVLDEAQCLPVDYLKPCLKVLRQLTSLYGTSTVLCTATQPAIRWSENFSIGLSDVHEIIERPQELYVKLKRVEVIDRGTLDDATLAEEIAAGEQVLIIVNTRKHAQTLFQLLPEDGANFHLSALMCPAHRSVVLTEVRRRLDCGLPVRLVSTQLIEAGVDVDFPKAYRSLAGIDAIAQAAGRCNRNGRQAMGELHLFRSEHEKAERYFRETAQVAARVLASNADPLGIESVQKFFSLYYLQHSPPDGEPWDSRLICRDFSINPRNRALPFVFQFESVARKFRLIENEQAPVLIPFDETARKLLDELRNESIPLHRSLLRGLQQYTVQIYRPEFAANAVQFEPVRDGQFHILICPETHYSAEIGLRFDNISPANLIA